MKEVGIVGVPRVPSGMLVRAGLRDRLGRAPLTVIRAPGGSGKTVLMAQWAIAQHGAGAWITVEPDGGSRLAFWTGLIDSLSHLGSGLQLPVEDSADRDVLRGALLRSFRLLQMPVVLVVDDAHELRDPLVVEDLLALLRANVNVTAVVGTRSRSELEAPRSALTLDVSVIEPDELAFTIDEIERFVGAGGSPFGSPGELLEASGGSPLLLRAILAGSTISRDTGGSAQAVIADHVAGLLRADDDLDLFASVTSVPDDLDRELAHRLSNLPRDRVSSMLDSLESEGLVMRREASGVTRFRYHPLVREVLRGNLRAHRPELFRSASLRSSADAEARKHFISALRHSVEAEDYNRASDVCLHGGFALLRSRGAAAILQAVPLRAVARLPFLAVILGLAANARGERLRALELLTLALGSSRAWRRSQRVAEQAGLALIEAVVLRITGRAADAVGPARRMLRILETSQPADLEEIADQLDAYRYQGAVTLFRAGRLAEARAAAERVGISPTALASGTPDGFGAVALIAAASAAMGECDISSMLIARLDDHDYPAAIRDGYVGSLAHLARGILALEQGDVAEAKRQLADFLARPNLEHRPLFTAFAAFVSLWDGTPEIGLRALDQRDATDRPRARLTAQDRKLAASARALLHVALGQVAPSTEALRGLDRGDPLGVVLQATVLLLQQRPDDVIDRLNRQTEWRGPRLQAAAELLTACAALLREDDDLATAALRRFLATSTVHGVITPLILVPRELRTQVEDLAERVGVDPVTLSRLRQTPSPFRLGVTRASLTRREADVLSELRSTASQSEIAANLSVSSNTVKSQLRTLYRKLDASSRDDALRAAYLQGLLDD